MSSSLRGKISICIALIMFSSCLFMLGIYFRIDRQEKNKVEVDNPMSAEYVEYIPSIVYDEVETTTATTTTAATTTTTANANNVEAKPQRVETTTKAKATTTTAATTTTTPATTQCDPEPGPGFQEEVSTSDISYTQRDLDMMAKVICQEAGGESDYIRIRVANVIINRALSRNFPSTIYSVLTAPKQYACAAYGWPKWATQDIVDQCYDVALRSINGERPFPENVVYQAGFRQGSGVYEVCESCLPGGDTFYFCTE